MVTVQWAGDVGGPIRLRPGTLLWWDGACVDYPDPASLTGKVRPGSFKGTYEYFAKILTDGVYKPTIL